MPKRSPSSSAKPSTSSANGTRPPRRSAHAIAATTPSGPSKAPASRTVSRCEPSSSVPASGSVPSTRPTRLPIASGARSCPPRPSRRPRARWRAIAGVAKRRVSRPGSSLTARARGQRQTTCSAQAEAALPDVTRRIQATRPRCGVADRMRIRWLSPPRPCWRCGAGAARVAAEWSEPLPVAPTPRPTRMAAVGIAAPRPSRRGMTTAS